MKLKNLFSNLYTTPRTLFFYFDVLLFLVASAVSSLGFVMDNAAVLIAGTLLLALWFVAMLWTLSPRTDVQLAEKLPLLRRGALVIFIALFSVGILGVIAIGALVPAFGQNQSIPANLRQQITGMQRDYKYSDGAALAQQAVDNLFNGQNPYAHANIVQAFQKYPGSYDSVTALRAGTLANVYPAPTDAELKQAWDNAVQNPTQVPAEMVSKVAYPAGSFLLPAPFLYLGIPDIRIVYGIFFLAGLLYAVWLIPKNKRLIFIGFALISLELWNTMAAGGEPANLCFPLLLIAWVALNRNQWVSAFCMGLAAATKQTVWFFLPFYLILAFQSMGLKKAALIAGVIAGVFIAVNLPFIIADPRLWLNSVLSPMTDPLFPVGSGVITLVTSGWLNIHTSTLFTTMEVTAFIVAAIWYFRNCLRYPTAGLIVALIPLFFAWRSLFSYFFYVDIIAMAYILVNKGNIQIPIDNNQVSSNIQFGNPKQIRISKA